LYHVFDGFLAKPRWSALHDDDVEADFYQALEKVFACRNFNSDVMAAYFIVHGTPHPQTGHLTFELRARDLATKAEAIRVFHLIRHGVFEPDPGAPQDTGAEAGLTA